MEINNFVLKMFFDPTKKLSIGVESLHCPMFSVKHSEYKIEKIGNGQGKDMEKYFVRSVGTLSFYFSH